MNLLYPVAGLMMLIGTPIYLSSVVKLHSIISAEHPDWVDRRGTLSFFYKGMPRVVDPNVNQAVLGIAFSHRWRSLESPIAYKYVRRIRIFLPSLLVVFGVVLVTIAVSAP